MHIGESLLVYDETMDNTIAQKVAAKIFGFMGLAQKELLITNAYIIPSQPAIDFIQSLTDRGVKVRILTNSLASHDVPAVNSHYKGWRDKLILAGAFVRSPGLAAELAELMDRDMQPARNTSQRIMDKIFKVVPKEQY